MSQSVTLRPARPSDQEQLGRLGTMLVVEHHSFDAQRFLAPDPETPLHYGQFLASHTQSRDRFVTVAEQDGRIVGYIFAGVEGTDYMALRGPAGALYDIVVDPEFRRHRIGRLLIESALAELRRRGAPRVVLFTAEKNANAQALFAAMGFRRTMIEMTCELDGGQP